MRISQVHALGEHDPNPKDGRVNKGVARSHRVIKRKEAEERNRKCGYEDFIVDEAVEVT